MLFRNGFSTISPKIFCVIPAEVLLESFRDCSLEGFQIPLGISPTYRLGIAPRTFFRDVLVLRTTSEVLFYISK